MIIHMLKKSRIFVNRISKVIEANNKQLDSEDTQWSDFSN